MYTKTIHDEPLRPKVLAGVERGEPMTREDANGGKPNPKFRNSHGYQINCQSCVVSYEARLRGYNVQTLPNTRGSALDTLSRDTDLAWIDPKTGNKAKGISCIAKNKTELYKIVDNTIKEGERYTFRFNWRGRRSGHVISADRHAGRIRLYDPQSGETMLGDKVLSYFDRIKIKVDEVEKFHGYKIPLTEEILYRKRPRLLRVDDKEFNLNIVNKIMEGASD